MLPCVESSPRMSREYSQRPAEATVCRESPADGGRGQPGQGGTRGCGVPRRGTQESPGPRSRPVAAKHIRRADQ